MEVTTTPNELTDATTERIVLAYMLLNASLFVDIVCKINYKHFFIPINKGIFFAISSLYASGISKIDELSLVQQLTKEYRDLGENISASQLELTVSTLFTVRDGVDPSNIAFYVNRLDSIYRKRSLVEYLDDNISYLKSVLQDQNVDFPECLAKVESGLISKLNEDEIDDPEDIFATLGSFAEELFSEKREIMGLSTGFKTLDDNIDGLENGTLTVIAAHKKIGKSACCMNIALNVAIEQRLPILYIDTEMSTTKNKTRILSRITDIPEKRLKRGDVTEEEKELVRKVTHAMEDKIKYFHKYVPGFTLDSVLSLIRSYHIKYGIKLAVFDYIKSGSSADFRSLKEYQLLGNMAIGLKDLAGILDIPILTAVQRSREGDIADSDRIARYADTIIFLETRSKEEVEEFGFSYGLYKFVVKHARSGGTTNSNGIGLQYKGSVLSMYEAKDQFDKEQILPMNEQDEESSPVIGNDDAEDVSDESIVSSWVK